LIRIQKWTLSILLILLLSLVFAACGGGASSSTTNTQTTTTPVSTSISTTTVPAGTVKFMVANNADLNGAGATFPAPLYTKWFDEYNKLTSVKINYQAVGSGAGINQITAGTVDFGASDGIMTDTQITAAKVAHGPILAIPMTSGAVAVIYNVGTTGGNVSGVKLTSDVLADIYLKKITNWTDGRITALNPEVKIPSLAIAVVHRSDSSGTTNIFTSYLTKISTEWAAKVGNANSVNWPGDVGGSGNAGVAGQVQQIPGAIGYVELAYALQNNLPYVSLKNAAGNFIAPSIASTTKAAVGVTIPDDTRVMLADSSNPDAYPIVGLTWILAYTNQTNKDKGVTLAKMLWWAIHDGQQYCAAMDYAPLAPDAVAKAEVEILSMTYGGQPIVNR
jgi:phosphate transport system substrate-binding protein